MQLARQHLRRHRLPRTAGAVEQGADAQAAAALRGETPGLVDLGALPQVGRDVSQGPHLRLRQDEVVPGGDGLDALCQIIQARARLRAAGLPQQTAGDGRLALFPGGAAQHRGGGRLNPIEAKAELRDHLIQLPVRSSRRGAQGPLPEGPLLPGMGLVDIQANGWPLTRSERVAARREDPAVHALQEREQRDHQTWVVRAVQIIGIHQQGTAGQHDLALPQAKHGFSLGRRGRNVGGSNHIQGGSQRGAACRGDGELSRMLGPTELDQGLLPAVFAGPDLLHPAGENAVRRGQLGRRRQQLHEPLQSFIQVGQAGQVVKNALIDSQRIRGQSAA